MKLKWIGKSIMLGFAGFGVLVIGAALWPKPHVYHPQVIECKGLNSAVKLHTEDLVQTEPHGYSSVARNGVRYYFQPSLDMMCHTYDEAPDI